MINGESKSSIFLAASGGGPGMHDDMRIAQELSPYIVAIHATESSAGDAGF